MILCLLITINAINANAIYAYGVEKCRVLSSLLRRSVIDVEGEFSCVEPSKTSLEGVGCLVPCHGLSRMACALRNATVLAQWLHYYTLSLQINQFCCQEVKAKGGGVDEVDDGNDCVCAADL